MNTNIRNLLNQLEDCGVTVKENGRLIVLTLPYGPELPEGESRKTFRGPSNQDLRDLTTPNIEMGRRLVGLR